ncbi:MAG: DUF1743 domain-containing protein [Thaumarchaeota archaeon]|nr:DUF1743 domain-containing protein [Nitrososphaerota archaeon]
MRERVLHIGFDDTDSTKGMCTTFLAYKIVQHLRGRNVEFMDYPYLIRFNPNIPWKTRGNGAVAIKIRTVNPAAVKGKIIEFVKRYSATDEGANPGLAFYESDEIPAHFSEFGRMALSTLVSRSTARKFAEKNRIETFHMGNGQGLVGAIGALGYGFDDHTYELISYRHRSNFGKKRIISKESVRKMQEITAPKTFNSYDDIKGRVLIAPHGPDPVFFGVRGEDVDSVVKGASLVKSDEKLSGYMVFRSNQGTGDHLRSELDLENMRPYSSGFVLGKVATAPRTVVGGHVMFTITKSGKSIGCAVYKPTGLAKIAAGLIRGDTVKLGGGIRRASKRYGRTLNIEFIDVIKAARRMEVVNPMCTRCARRMKSKGRGQGFRCERCGQVSQSKVLEEVPRSLVKGLYLPVPSAHRHLTRPLQRVSKFNTGNEFDNSKKWFSISMKSRGGKSR